MSVERLIQDGKIRPFNATEDEIRRTFEIARRDLSLAKRILDESLDWCFSIAYNSVLQACRSYMFHLGYRPSAIESHKTVFEFIELMVEAPYKETVLYFDRVRRKRHRTIYDEVGLVSRKEAEELLEAAEEFIAYIEKSIKK